MYPELVVLKTEDDNEAENGVSKVCDDAEFEDSLKLLLNAIISPLFSTERLSLVEVTSWFIITSIIIGCLNVEGCKKRAHEEEEETVDDLTPNQLTLVILIHFFMLIFINYNSYLIN